MRSAIVCIWVCVLVGACGGGGGGSSRAQTRVQPPANSAPVADAGADQQVVEETLVALDGSASRDPDGVIASYAWLQVAGPGVVLDGSAAATATFLAPVVDADTRFAFQLTVTDTPGGSATDRVDVTVVPETHGLSGIISAARGIDVDGDVNDPQAPLLPNDRPSQAQPIANPITVGGYVNVAGAGEPGALQTLGDISDFYRVSVAAGQSIRVQVADPQQGDPDLYLWNAAGTTILDGSLNADSSENLVAPGDGEVLIEVQAFSGASNYTLILGQARAAAVGGLVLSADFVPGEIIVERRALAKAGARSTPDGLDASGTAVTGPVGRPVLARLDDTAARVAAQASGSGSSAALAALADERQRRKYRTLLAIKALRRDPGVVYAEPNHRIEAQATPNDPFYPLQWHYPMIDLPAAWDITLGDAAVSVAVIDTGALLGHPDLAGRLTAGYDFVSDPVLSADGDGIDPDPEDAGDGGDVQLSSFHGTHVAGTVAAASDNGIGVAGVAPGVNVVPVRVLAIGGGTSYDIIQGMRWAAGVDNDSGLTRLPVDVMNLSLGRLGPCTQAEQAAFDVVRAQGVVVVAAAGNDSIDASQTFPATCHGVIAVGAVDLLGNRAFYSNFGSLVDVQAPGGDGTVDQNGDGYGDGVLSTQGDPGTSPPGHVYAFAQGTSMAAPHVAGVVALMRSVNPALTPDEIDQLLADGALADDRGVINAHAAVSAALDATGAPPVLNPTLTVSPTALNFGSVFTHATLDVRVSGGGSLQASAPTVSETWLHVTPQSVSAGGIGRYGVTVDRGQLADGTHTGVITVASDRNTVEVSVIMQVSGTAVDADAGHLYVLLVDASTGEVADHLELDADGGSYDYQLAAPEPGEYEIIAGTDLDNDGFICDGGERCGVYPTLDRWGTPFVVEGPLDGLDFSVGDVIPIAGAAASSGAMARRPGDVAPVAVRATGR